MHCIVVTQYLTLHVIKKWQCSVYESLLFAGLGWVLFDYDKLPAVYQCCLTYGVRGGLDGMSINVNDMNECLIFYAVSSKS